MRQGLPDLFTRRNIIFFTLLGLVLAVMYMVMVHIPAAARTKVQSLITAAGFSRADIGSFSIGPGSIEARDIKLDNYGFDEIKRLSADIGWVSFLTGGTFQSLEIDGLHIARQPGEINVAGSKALQALLNLPDYRVELKNGIIDLGTPFGDLRFFLEASVNGDEAAKTRTLKARITADQYQLGFSSDWTGQVRDDGQLELSATVLDGRAHAGPLRVSRFNGWIGATLSSAGYSAQSQMEAGSATFMDVPLQNITVVNDHRPAEGNMVIRTGISGIPDVLFAADLVRSAQGQAFSAVLKGNNLGGLLDHIEEVTGHNKNLQDELSQIRAFEFTTRFQPERRFVGGPLPFEIILKADSERLISGNALFYPDTLEMRGSLETDGAITAALKEYFKIPSASINQNFIRLDSSMKRFFAPPAETAAK